LWNKKGGSNSSQKCLYNETSQNLDGECPGVKHFNEIKDSIVIDPNAVYTIFGHGCDLEHELLDIPESTNYITACWISNCRTKTRDLWIDFLNNTLKKPITNETLNKYESWIGV